MKNNLNPPIATRNLQGHREQAHVPPRNPISFNFSPKQPSK